MFLAPGTSSSRGRSLFGDFVAVAAGIVQALCLLLNRAATRFAAVLPLEFLGSLAVFFGAAVVGIILLVTNATFLPSKTKTVAFVFLMALDGGLIAVPFVIVAIIAKDVPAATISLIGMTGLFC
mmetsp:Transcript_5135/g.16832  ORF Transcript_5135/g.16832 Transcript_5135/m.16832 type:complete len:124 (-) Transcript_5135:509-880(-)